MSFYQVFIIY